MELKNLVEAVSTSTGVAPDSVKKVLDAAFAAVSKQMSGEEPIKLHGFGTFTRKAGKEEGKSRVVFRQWKSEGQKEAKKQKKLAKKAAAAS